MLSLRMESYRTQGVVLALVGLISLPLRAGVIPGRWEKVSQLEAGAPLTLEMKNGDRIKGHFMGLSESIFELLIHPSRAAIPRDDIQRITHHPRDGVGDGVGRGALYGAAAGAGLGALFEDPEGGGSVEQKIFNAAVAGAIGALIGVGLGLVSDAVVKTPSAVVYEARLISR